MDSDKVLSLLKEVAQQELNIERVQIISAKPHMYVVGPNHLSRNDSMYLGETQILEMEKKHGPMCYHEEYRGGPRCKLLYNLHTVEYGAFISATRNLTKEEIHAALMALKPVAEGNGIAGFAFVKNEYTIEGLVFP